MTADNDNTFY